MDLFVYHVKNVMSWEGQMVARQDLLEIVLLLRKKMITSTTKEMQENVLFFSSVDRDNTEKINYFSSEEP